MGLATASGGDVAVLVHTLWAGQEVLLQGLAPLEQVRARLQRACSRSSAVPRARLCR